jgi:outer membrane protein OmpA-like peptidoglycan-associated protein
MAPTTAALLMLLAAGCAPSLPAELADARSAYQHAGAGPAAELRPADLRLAREALDKAELAFKQHPFARRTRDLSYAAQRQAQLAEVLANGELAARVAGERFAEKVALVGAEFKVEARGSVIILADSAMFAPEQAVLLPLARAKLALVADALLATRERNVVVEDHGQDLRLSQRRADAVRGFMLLRGYRADRLRASGAGNDEPASSNRLEIIIQPATP